MNDPISLLRERLGHTIPRGRHGPAEELHAADPVQLLTAKLLLFTGIGTALEAWKNGSSGGRHTGDLEALPHVRELGARPIAWAPALLGVAAAVAHAVHAFTPTERSRLATRTFDVAVVGAGLLGLADTLASAKRNGELPDMGSVSLASAGLLGILIDRSDSRHEAERLRLQRRADVVERLVPKRSPRLDRVVVHV